MAGQLPETRTMKASDARQQWSQLLTRVFRGESRVIVEKSGIPVAAIISADDLEKLTRIEARREDGWTAIQELRARNRDMDPDEVERDVAEAIAEVRAARRAQEATTPSA